MNHFAVMVLASWVAGIAAFAGGLCAKLAGTAHTTEQRERVHAVVAFGGGVLLAAVAFALVPPGMTHLSPAVLAVTFALGGIAFCALDAHLTYRGGNTAQFMAMLMDFVPEAIALGALFGHDHKTGILLALFIGAQNLPEGFNAFRERVLAGARPRAVLAALGAISLLGPAAACGGRLFLQGRATYTAGLMSFAAGGILYLIFQDIAPLSKMRGHWTPPLGAVLGFTVGLLGKQLLG